MKINDLPGNPVNVERWSRWEQWHCECGPSSTRVSADEMLKYSQSTRASASCVGKTYSVRGKKVGCSSCFHVRYLSPCR